MQLHVSVRSQIPFVTTEMWTFKEREIPDNTVNVKPSVVFASQRSARIATTRIRTALYVTSAKHS